MRSVRVDHARRRNSKERGGDWSRGTLALGHPNLAATETTAELLGLSDALDELMDLQSDLAEVIDVRFFCGLGIDAMAEALGLGTRTVERRLRTATAWLFDHFGDAQGPA